MTKLEKIVEKVKKLLALGGSPNKEEAQVAIFRAQQLIEKYNIEEGLLEDEENKIIEEIVAEVFMRPFNYHEIKICTICAKLFGCEIIIYSYAETRLGGKLEIIGPKLQVECAKNAKALLKEREKNRQEAGHGLVLLGKVQEYIKNKYPKLGSNQSNLSGDKIAYDAGRKAGEGISLNVHKPMDRGRLLE